MGVLKDGDDGGGGKGGGQRGKRGGTKGQGSLACPSLTHKVNSPVFIL